MSTNKLETIKARLSDLKLYDYTDEPSVTAKEYNNLLRIIEMQSECLDNINYSEFNNRSYDINKNLTQVASMLGGSNG